MRTIWFIISSHLAAVNQAQSTKQQVKGPGSLFPLGLCAKKKSTLRDQQVCEREREREREREFQGL